MPILIDPTNGLVHRNRRRIGVPSVAIRVCGLRLLLCVGAIPVTLALIAPFEA